MKTPVIYRKFRKGADIIALFPDKVGTSDWQNTCDSYRHTVCSVNISRITYPAKKSEYMPIHKELEALGYNLTIVKKFTPAHAKARKLQVEDGLIFQSDEEEE